MNREELARVREEAAAAVSREVIGWDVKYAKLLGIADALLGGVKGTQPKCTFMARKLCAYYMRNEGYTFRQIADTVGLANHTTAMHHYHDCKDFIEGGHMSDKDYLKAHKLAKDNGIW